MDRASKELTESDSRKLSPSSELFWRLLSCVWLFATPWTIAPQAPLLILQARIQEWVAMPSSRASSQPRDQTQVSGIAGRFITSWASRRCLWGEKTGISHQDAALSGRGIGLCLGVQLLSSACHRHVLSRHWPNAWRKCSNPHLRWKPA